MRLPFCFFWLQGWEDWVTRWGLFLMRGVPKSFFFGSAGYVGRCLMAVHVYALLGHTSQIRYKRSSDDEDIESSTEVSPCTVHSGRA